MVYAFKVGKVYRYKVEVDPNPVGFTETMSKMLDGKPHKCVVSENKTNALFEGFYPEEKLHLMIPFRWRMYMKNFEMVNETPQEPTC